jgi:hypothetical protein
MVAGSVLDNVQGDSTCTDPEDPSTCTIFAGEYEYCSWEVTGLGSDCCASPGGIDILAYIATANAALEINQMTEAGRFAEGAAGAYESLSAPINDALKLYRNGQQKVFEVCRSQYLEIRHLHLMA